MDPERERMRLVELYGGMSDEELAEIAEDWESLTDAAHLALKMELDRRGIKIEVEGPDAHEVLPQKGEDLALADPVAVAEYAELGEAMMAKGFLESGGIRCALSDMYDNVIDPTGFIKQITGAVGYSSTDFSFHGTGFKLLVEKADADIATEALERLTKDAPDFDRGEADKTDVE